MLLFITTIFSKFIVKKMLFNNVTLISILIAFYHITDLIAK